MVVGSHELVPRGAHGREEGNFVPALHTTHSLMDQQPVLCSDW